MAGNTVPVVLFVYARSDLLSRTLAALKANEIPRLYVFCDGPRDPAAALSVQEVRQMVRSVDWCEKTIVERATNLGLGASILRGVSEVLAVHDALIVMEDDIVCSRGAYRYMTAALERYRDDSRVMSVAAWTHPLLRPSIPKGAPYFDGRFACWGWGTWRRAWKDMDTPARVLLRKCRLRSRDVYCYGADIGESAFYERAWNVWAVRFVLSHYLRRGLCFHPPHSLSIHIGYDDRSSNTKGVGLLGMTELAEAPAIPADWPEPEEARECAALWQAVKGGRPSLRERGSIAWRHVRSQLRYRMTLLRKTSQ